MDRMKRNQWLFMAASVLGPVLVNYLREYQLASGVPREAAYNQTMYILAGLLGAGFVCNVLVRPVAARFFMTDAEVAAEKGVSAPAIAQREEGIHADFEDFVEEERENDAARRAGAARTVGVPAPLETGPGALIVFLLAWIAVGVPLAWGTWVTLQKTAVMLH